MKKIIILLINAMVQLFVIFSMAGDGGIDKKFLTKNAFKFGTLISGGELVFSSDGTYTYEYGGAGLTWYDRGTYTIKNDTVSLKPDVCSFDRKGNPVDCGKTMGEALCSVQSKDDDLYYSTYFTCTSKKNKNAVTTDLPSMAHPVESSRVKAGLHKNFRGTPVVTMGMVKGVTGTSVKIREKPSVNARSLEYIKELYGPGPVLQAVPAGTEVIVVARTRDRDSVQSWNNYWYLVNLGFNTEVWMFGEFVKIK